MKVWLIVLPADRIVILGDTMVYAEDDDEYPGHSAHMLARNIAKALGGVTLKTTDLSDSEVFTDFLAKHGIDQDEWTYRDVVSAVLGEEVRCAAE